MDWINPGVSWNSGSHLNTELFVVEHTPGFPILWKKSHIDFRIAFKLQVLAIKLTALISSITFFLQFQLSIKYHGWSIRPWNVNSDYYFVAVGLGVFFLSVFPWFVDGFLNFKSTAYVGYSGSCSSNAIIFNVSWEKNCYQFMQIQWVLKVKSR